MKPRSSIETLISLDTVGKPRFSPGGSQETLGKFGLADCILFSFQHQHPAWRTFPPPGKARVLPHRLPHPLDTTRQAAGWPSRASSTTPQWSSPPRTPTPRGPFPFSCPDAVGRLRRVAPHLRRATPRKWRCGPIVGPQGPGPKRRAVSEHRGCVALPRFPSPLSEAGVLGPHSPLHYKEGVLHGHGARPGSPSPP